MAKRLWVGTRKGLFVWSKRAGNWQIEETHFLGEPVTMHLPRATDGSTYAVLTLGHFGAKLRRRAPGESEWTECAVPVFPEGCRVNGHPPMGDEPPQTKPASLSEIWALEDDRQSPGGLWAGTIPGGLFHSRDAGGSWQLVESLWNRPERDRWFGGGKDEPGIHSVCVDPRDSRTVTLGVSCGGVWQSTDAGESWTCYGKGLRADYMPPEMSELEAIQDPHRLSQCQSDPSRVWMQHHNGIFVSSDAGHTWRTITAAKPSTFGFAVAGHPHDPQTAWFVPASVDQCRVPVDGKVVVSRTRDGGETFEVLSRGLPGPNAFDLVFRHGLDVDAEGKSLAMASTTGGLWLSENGGDDWQTLSHNLPPVYVVRWEEG